MHHKEITDFKFISGHKSELDLSSYERAVYHAIHFGMINRNQMEFYYKHIDEIKNAVGKTLAFINGGKLVNEDANDWHKVEIIEGWSVDSEYYDEITLFAVACLPFMIADFKIENPQLEDRAEKKMILKALYYIKQNNFLANHLIDSITTDDRNCSIQEDKLNKQIEIFEWMTSGKKQLKKKFWSHVIQFQYLARIIDIALGDELGLKKQFLSDFFELFGKEVDDDVIEQQILIPSRTNPVVCFSDEHIDKILALPTNTKTKVEIVKKSLESYKKLLA